MTQDRSKQTLVLYKAGVKVTEGPLGGNLANIAGITPGTTVATGDYQAAYSDGTTESDKVDVPGFTVPIINVSGITVNDKLDMKVGDTQTLNIGVQPENATDKSFSTSSNNPAIAQVDESGTVLAHVAGTAEITITTTDGNKAAVTQVTVTDKVVKATGVTAGQKTASMKVGDTKQIAGMIAPENATDKALTYLSSDESIATVAVDGTITAVAPGNADVTVTTHDGGFTDKTAVTVNPVA